MEICWLEFGSPPARRPSCGKIAFTPGNRFVFALFFPFVYAHSYAYTFCACACIIALRREALHVWELEICAGEIVGFIVSMVFEWAENS